MYNEGDKVKIIRTEYEGIDLENTNIEIGDIATFVGYTNGNSKDIAVIEFDNIMKGWTTEKDVGVSFWYVRLGHIEKV